VTSEQAAGALLLEAAPADVHVDRKMRKETCAMSKKQFNAAEGSHPDPKIIGDGAQLLARYGAHLDDMDISDIQKQEFLKALFLIMQGFVDLGFNIGRGEKFASDAALGMDDVLKYLIPEDTAHETVAPPPTDKDTEAR
jgi:hypothetical protein